MIMAGRACRPPWQAAWARMWAGAVERGGATVCRVAGPGRERGGPRQPTCSRAETGRMAWFSFFSFSDYFDYIQIIQELFQNS
jgi:hypothetical protein